MYQYLTGKLAEKTPSRVTIDANGIGYELIVPLSTSQALPHVGTHIKLLTHFIVREDHHQLYGFLKEDERELFRYLISVSGIGPKLAMTVLSGLGVPDLKHAIVDGAVPVLSAISGIGKKTAERIIIELREKIIVDDSQTVRLSKHLADESLVEDSIQALVALGYRKQNAKAAIQKVLSMNESGKKIELEEVIRQSLKYV